MRKKRIMLDGEEQQIRIDFSWIRRDSWAFSILSRIYQLLPNREHDMDTDPEAMLEKRIIKPFKRLQASGKMPSVSVIIPTYFLYEDIGDQIRSVLEQDYKDMELIIVNDNPGKKLVIRDKRVKVISNKRQGGRSYARNRGAEAAKCEVLLFLDADIRLNDKTAVRKVARFFSDHRADNVVLKGRAMYDMDRYQSDGWFSDYARPPQNLSRYQPTQPIDQIVVFWSNLFAVRREQFERYRFCEEYGKRYAYEDLDFAAGQMVEGKARILFVTDIYGTSVSDRKEPIEYSIRKYLEAGINRRLFVNRWKGRKLLKSYPLKDAMGASKVFRRLEREKLDLPGTIRLLRGYVNALSRIGPFKEGLGYVPIDLSIETKRIISFTSQIAEYLGSHFLTDSNSIERTMREIFRK